MRRAVGAQYPWSVPAVELPPVFNVRCMPVSVPIVLLVKKITLLPSLQRITLQCSAAKKCDAFTFVHSHVLNLTDMGLV